MTLPAHRFLQRKKEQQKPADLGPPYTWVLDVDDTITAAPQRYQRLVEGMKAVGDKVVILTGHGPRETREHLLEALGIEWDEIVIVDPGPYGEGKREALEGLNAFMLFDDRVEFGPEVIKACPVAFQYVEPPGDNNAKKDAKKAAKALNRSKERSTAAPPPNLRVSDSPEGANPEHECGTCLMYDAGLCWGYGNLPVDGEWMCDSWVLDPNWQEQDAEQDAAAAANGK